MSNDRRRKPTASDAAATKAAALLTTPRQIGVRVPARMGEQLEAIARRENNGVSAVVRRLLTSALALESEAAS